MKIGIDKIGFSTSQYVLNMNDLAIARGADPEKYSQGLMLDALSITPITEDIITLGASAANQIITDEDRQKIDLIIFATESSIDQSKAASIYIHRLLNIQPFARSIEMKEACYSATAALDYANLHIGAHPESRVLVIASDIAKYGIHSAGESTQGSGAIAFILKKDPRILTFNNDNLAQTRDIMDFWRPNYSTTPFVNGIYSTKQYLDSLKTTWKEFQNRQGKSITDFDAFCFHIPFPKLALKGLKKVLPKDLDTEHSKKLNEHFQASIAYSRQVGNIYSGSLYLGLLSLLENSNHLKAGDTIALFSYGSGAVSEIFSMTLVEGYQNQLQLNRLDKLNNRQSISVKEYEELFYEEACLDEEGNANFNAYKTGEFALEQIKEHQRIYVNTNEIKN
ncbi:hydroxymethylglutaryl-CoA synthase [Streptococcus urinalis FB127-CNA-2]|uniref:Hydroxymethylglutaryl-CoA synthase n=1 Tax=Streptococcus urinalis 2285-97 TaxID=764291 RepID=G5KFH0_9STRE|nr:hydroxymethylglutaryl-CoA synthase [Streptococcus urinalis]EHJ56540.1 hydroxymethylglutaryl-CoA synthase [Streptococcus urinalis 2285-97]EKS22071.1 hydroxymethylglutaryl-CoA synthase [Streptococcus urinalis FB127-CNA-2]VEF31883.1 Hydroxymethylglutaryl-CoA synthase [Streptococcus urinalis]